MKREEKRKEEKRAIFSSVFQQQKTAFQADAYAGMYQAKQMKKEGKLTAAERLLSLSIAKLRQALKTCGADLSVQFKLSQVVGFLSMR
jgi:hypothetical protein